MIKNYISIICLLISSSFHSLSQGTSVQMINEWLPYFSNESIQVDVKEQNCNDLSNGLNNNYIFIRISNKTTDSLKLTFEKNLEYNNETKSNKSDLSLLILAPNQVLEAACFDRKSKSLYFFHSQVNGKNKNVLTKYNLFNFVMLPVSK